MTDLGRALGALAAQVVAADQLTADLAALEAATAAWDAGWHSAWHTATAAAGHAVTWWPASAGPASPFAVNALDGAVLAVAAAPLVGAEPVAALAAPWQEAVDARAALAALGPAAEQLAAVWLADGWEWTSSELVDTVQAALTP